MITPDRIKAFIIGLIALLAALVGVTATVSDSEPLG